MNARLIVGTINYWPDDGNWRNVLLDISERGIYDHELDIFVLPDIVTDIASNLPMFRDSMFDEVVAHHVFEHLTFEQATQAVRALYRVLKRGGILDIEVPDMSAICHAWVTGENTPEELQQWIYGEQLANHERGDNHRYGYWEGTLRNLLEGAKFTVGNREASGLALRFKAVKR